MGQHISRLKKTIVIASAAALTLAGAGVALAYWTSTGTGDGTATTGDPVEFAITADDAVGVLAPGSAGQTVGFTVTNPGPGQLYLGTVTATIADSDNVPWVPAGDCDPDDYTVTMTTAVASGTMLVGVPNARTGTVTVTMANSSVNQDDCQGQTVPLHFVADSVIPL